MVFPVLLSIFALSSISIPFVYLTGKRSPRAAAIFVASLILINLGLLAGTIPTIMDSSSHQWIETYQWIPNLGNTQFTLFVDGMSVSVALISLVLLFTATIYSINYMAGKKNLPAYYALICMLSVGLVGVFLTSNLLLFYFCWELMLVPAYFIVGEWGHGNSYKSALKLFIFTHAGAVFVLLGIGSIYWLTGTTEMFTVNGILGAQAMLLGVSASNIIKWILLALTAGFAVKMAVFPVHIWLPDAHSEAPAPMSALLSGVVISAGAYAILRIVFGVVFPAIDVTFAVSFLHALSIIAIITAFFGSFLALRATDIKRVIAYSSISHMGYIMFGISLFPVSVAGGTAVVLASSIAITGTILHIISHAASKGLFFLTAGGIMHQLNDERDIRKMGGLASKMPFSTVSGMIAALSIAGIPPLACFISEFLIFMGAFQLIAADSFYIIPTALMLVATVFSLAYSLRFISKVFFGTAPGELVEDVHGGSNCVHDSSAVCTGGGHGGKFDVPNWMKAALAILAALVVLIGVYPTFFMQLIQTVTFG
ncbi:MAG: NADH-quinone oxidoreductase subunit M [Nitrososphaerota archaeon]|jgi:NADH-quinone oxidoreductase subunit M|nr:NADH-quinone oxidoreductase subunit M [Nitrososphaerota archaeon]